GRFGRAACRFGSDLPVEMLARQVAAGDHAERLAGRARMRRISHLLDEPWNERALADGARGHDRRAQSGRVTRNVPLPTERLRMFEQATGRRGGALAKESLEFG